MNYEPNNILLIHISIEKTPYAFSDKRQRDFDKITKFVRFEGGNVVDDLLRSFPKISRIIIPLSFTKYIAIDINEYIEKYKDLFIIDNIHKNKFKNKSKEKEKETN
jgi:hypothetical protein